MLPGAAPCNARAAGCGTTSGPLSLAPNIMQLSCPSTTNTILILSGRWQKAQWHRRRRNTAKAPLHHKLCYNYDMGRTAPQAFPLNKQHEMQVLAMYCLPGSKCVRAQPAQVPDDQPGRGPHMARICAGLVIGGLKTWLMDDGL